MSVSTSEEDGVIGYQVTTVTPANSAPIAAAALPSTMILPAVASIRRTANGSRFSIVAAWSNPARAAATFRSRAFGLAPNCFAMACSISAMSMESSRASDADVRHVAQELAELRLVR